MSVCINPTLNNNICLPFKITCIGSQEDQCPMNRSQGYPMHQFIFSKKGSGLLTIHKEEYEIKEGDIFYLSPSTPHSYIGISKQWSTDWIHFSGFAVEKTLENLSLDTSFVYRNVINQKINHLLFDLTSLLKHSTEENYTVASTILYQLIISIHESIISNKNSEYSSEFLDFKKSINYIEDKYTSSISLNDLATITNVTPQHYCKLFKDQFDQRPIEYINKRRLQEAKRLLLESSKPIQTIATLVGFDDNSYFAAQFKRHEGMTPSQFRGGRRNH